MTRTLSTGPIANRDARSYKAAAVAALLLAMPHPLVAQVTPPALPRQSDISRERVTLPVPETPNFDLSIQAPERAAIPRAVDAVEFQVRAFVVEGATAFSAAQVDAFFTPLTGRTIGLEAVRDATAKLENLYRENGYFLSRVFVPPQQIENETLKIRVIEGYIGDLYVEGMDERSRAAVRRLLAPLLARKPIDLASVERRLLTLNDLPGISGTSVLRQGAETGASDLVVSLVQPRNFYQLSVNNSGSKILGPWGYGANANLNRPFNLPGVLNLGISAGGRKLEAVRTAIARYSVALGSQGLIGSLGAIVARAKPAGSLRPLDIQNDLLSVSARGRYPIMRGRTQSLFAETGLSVNRSKTDIFGQELVDDRTTVGDVGLIYQQSGWLDGATTASVNYFQALPILGAMEESAPLPSVLDFDADFSRITVAIQRSQALPDNFSALLSAQGQYTDSKLLSGELISFGGPAIGRGYDPSAITGDRGLGALAELRYDAPLSKSGFNNAQFYTFFDGAHTISLATPMVERSTDRIRSLGAGVRLYHRYGLVDVQVADAQRRIGGSDARSDPRFLISAAVVF
ncbi:MAG: hypothetical protein M3Q15_03610 [Pseudomonadota bacterium]|nr:hypothetical protein [Pseudomonadota bacterium]